MQKAKRFVPPKPLSLWSVAALARTIWRGDGDLLSLLPAAAYKMKAGNLGFSRRGITLFNDPEQVRQILFDRDEAFPKSDLMVNALEPLIGDSVFVTYGERWRRQRAMIDPAFSLIRIQNAFRFMQATIDDYESRLEKIAKAGETISIDQAMSELTADIICRSVFSTPLASGTARDVFEDFNVFERSVAQVEIWRLIVQKAWSEAPQKPEVLAACKRIRSHLGDLVDTHLDDNDGAYNDIASSIIAARDSETGKPLTREELIDQLGVFFLAGHETTASVLTWVFFILATRPEILQRVRKEVSTVAGSNTISLEDTKKMPLVRSIFRETLRLYPPVTFLPRVAERETLIGKRRIRRGTLVMISPWTIHRHRDLWPDPHAFDPERFMPGRDYPKTAYIPFGAGPHTCVGASFALAESALIIARLARQFDFQVLEPAKVRVAARLTTRPAELIQCKVLQRAT
jgi:cytochrome P450